MNDRHDVSSRNPDENCPHHIAYHVKDGAKGPMVWEAKSVPLWIKDARGLPVGPYHLVICRRAPDPTEVKFFLSNAPVDTPLTVLLRVAFDRWRIERMFEDSKGELGLDHFEVRRYGSLRRHLLLTCVSHLFLAEFRERQKKNAVDLTLRQVWRATRALVSLWYRGGRCSRKRAESIAAQLAITQERKRPIAAQPPQANSAAITGLRLQDERSNPMPLAKDIAL